MRKKDQRFAYAIVSPGLILLCVLMFYPFIRNMVYSFTNYKMTKPNYTYVGLKNYQEVLSGKDFQMALENTIIWVILNIILMMVIGVLSAYVMNSKKIKCAFLLEVVLLLPWILPEAITGYTWKLLLNYESGIYYKLLLALHIIPEKYDIFAHSFSAMMACVCANVWRSFPLIGLTTLAKLRTLPMDWIEAAQLDGANRFQIFWNIEMPYICPVLFSTGTLCFIWTFNAYGIISVMTNGGPAKATQVVSILMQKQAFQYFDYSIASTYAVLILLILLFVVFGMKSLPKVLGNRREKNR